MSRNNNTMIVLEELSVFFFRIKVLVVFLVLNIVLFPDDDSV
jgi:hypothetical protein